MVESDVKAVLNEAFDFVMALREGQDVTYAVVGRILDNFDSVDPEMRQLNLASLVVIGKHSAATSERALEVASALQYVKEALNSKQ